MVNHLPQALKVLLRSETGHEIVAGCTLHEALQRFFFASKTNERTYRPRLPRHQYLRSGELQMRPASTQQYQIIGEC